MKKTINIRIMAYYLLRLFFGTITKMLFFTKVQGRENLPKEGPFIIVANHTSFADVPVVARSMPFVVRWIAREDVYSKPYLKPFHKILNTIVVNGSIEKALAALRNKEVICIFPEGARTPDGKLQKCGEGVAVLALKSGAQVVPVGISGMFKAFSRKHKFPKFHPVLVTIGRPLVFPKAEEEIIEEGMLRKTTEGIMSKVAELIVDM